MATTTASPRQISIAKPTAASRQSGLLPVPGSATNQRSPSSAQKNREVRLKVVVRRLAPGLTEQEFRTALGEEWLVGRGKVDWTSYRHGKIAKDAAKPSKPSRAYLHLTSSQHLGTLADRIATTQFVDAKASSSDSVLLGPPTVVFTPFSKIPGKARLDGRQGTIDQDPEFIDFLTSLTQPIVKPSQVDSAADKENKQSDAKTVTPLVQYIKDKKANKLKEGKTQKHGRQESKDNKGEDKKSSSAKGGKGKAAIAEKKGSGAGKADKNKPEIPNKAVKTSKSTKAAKASTSVNVPENAAPQDASSPAKTTPISARPERRRERGNASMAAKILQRDLALVNGGSGRRRRDNAIVASEASVQQIPISQEPLTQAPVVSRSSTTSDPVAITADTVTEASPIVQPSPIPDVSPTPQNQTPANQSTVSIPVKTSPVVSTIATQAFLKHANPSQGVTEPLLEEAFKVFGEVTKVEIDKKKGFAYIDFIDSASLQKAIAASPVKVAQGQVVVLERKTGVTLQNRNARAKQGSTNANSAANANQNSNRGGRGAGRGRNGRGPVNSVKTANTTPANISTPAPPTIPP